ncbi:hypothetical protein FDUTEX481_06770 [Tolypothrix sp. PCC 7601]|nr:hypothetical protein FDUTEX481_06770 [Tolypothrix sp. PCC 7601]
MLLTSLPTPELRHQYFSVLCRQRIENSPITNHQLPITCIDEAT